MTLHQLGHDAISLATLLFLEIVLGIDNLVFVSIATHRLPKDQQKKAQQVGLSLALLTRLMLLACAAWLASLNTPLFELFDFGVSLRDLIFLLGGVFLLYKGTEEIHNECQNDANTQPKASKQFGHVIIQIAVLDIVFSLDSVITAIGMTQEYYIMALAIIIAILVMIFSAHPITQFIEKNPSVKMLAVSFILMVGMLLVAEGMHFHVPRGYVYFSILFSLFVEGLNLFVRKRKLHKEIS